MGRAPGLCVGGQCALSGISPRAGSMVMSFGWPVVCVCVCAQQDVPVLWLSDHLFLAVGFCMSVYF